MSATAFPTPLISATQLAQALAGDPPAPTVLDARWQLGGPPGAEQYARGHIPGAVFVDLDAELAAPAGPRGRHPLPDHDAFATSMRAKGVSQRTPVAVYDDGAAIAAARAWWLLRYFGHPQVAVLDGGLNAWRRAGLPIVAERSEVTPGDFAARPGGMPMLDSAGAAGLARRGVLLDARAPERFAGAQEPVDPVAGHIPGARNHPAGDVLAADGRLLDPATLRATFASAGVDDDVVVGAYCGSGVSAALEVLALERAGYHAALYVGSWSEWITDPRRPVATD